MSHQNAHGLQVQVVFRVEPAVHGVEGDVDVGDAVEDLGPERGLVRRLGLAVAADQRHLEKSIFYSVHFFILWFSHHFRPLANNVGGKRLIDACA